jgi:hypothetical protein
MGRAQVKPEGGDSNGLREYKREHSSLQAGHNQRLLGPSSKRKVAMAAMDEGSGITHTLPATDANPQRGLLPPFASIIIDMASVWVE